MNSRTRQVEARIGAQLSCRFKLPRSVAREDASSHFADMGKTCVLFTGSGR